MEGGNFAAMRGKLCRYKGAQLCSNCLMIGFLVNDVRTFLTWQISCVSIITHNLYRIGLEKLSFLWPDTMDVTSQRHCPLLGYLRLACGMTTSYILHNNMLMTPLGHQRVHNVVLGLAITNGLHGVTLLHPRDNGLTVVGKKIPNGATSNLLGSGLISR